MTVRKPFSVMPALGAAREAILVFRWRSSAPLIIGTIASQLIGVATLPLLSRLYDPASFGVFALAQSFSALFVLASTLNLSGVVPTIPRLTQATRFASMLLAVVLATAVVLAVVVAADPPPLSMFLAPADRILGLESILLGLTSAAFLILRFYYIKLRGTNAVAGAQIARALLTVGTAVGFALLPHAASYPGTGLILSTATGDVSAIVWLVIALPARRRWQLAPLRPRRMIAVIRRHSNVAAGAGWANLVGTVVGQLPLWVIITAFGPVQAGWYALANRVVTIPTAFVGQTLTGVLSSHLSAEYYAGKPIRRTLRLAMLSLAGLGLVGYGALTLAALTGMASIFGPRWTGATTSLMIMSIMGFTVFVSGGTNFVPLMLRASGFLFRWSTGRAIANITVLLVAWRLGWTYDALILAYAVSESLVYAAFSWFVWTRPDPRGAA